jgi:hypothetical protein
VRIEDDGLRFNKWPVHVLNFQSKRPCDGKCESPCFRFARGLTSAKANSNTRAKDAMTISCKAVAISGLVDKLKSI